MSRDEKSVSVKCRGLDSCGGEGCSHGKPHKENKECHSGCYTVKGVHCRPIDELEVNEESMRSHFFEMWIIGSL